MIRRLLALLPPLLLTAPPAEGRMHVSDTADFATGANTNGWTFAAGSWTSPAYPTNVASFALVGTNLSEGATLSVTCSRNTFTLLSSGGARPVTFTAEYTLSRLPPPEGLTLTNLVDGAFAAVWQPVEDAVGYRLAIFSNHVEGAVAGTPVFAESFDGVPGKGSVTAIDADTFDALTDTHAGWRVHTCYHAASPLSGVVQIGSSAALGHLALPLPPDCAGAGRTLQLAARRYAAAGRDMPVTLVSADGATTNAVGSVALTESAGVHHIPLPPLTAGDVLCLHSTTNKIANREADGRVLLDAVAILDGYDPGRTETVSLAAVDVAGTAFATNGLPPFVGSVAVVALAAHPADDSDAAVAALDLVNPPPMPILRAVPLSGCDESGVYAADFGGLSNVTAATTWYNGVWPVPYWMGYNDQGALVSSVRKATTNTTYSGFFAFRSAAVPDMGWALGFRGSSSRDFHHGIAFWNDTDSPRIGFGLSFAYVQWNWRNELPMTNTVEYLVTNELVGTAAPGGWVSVPALTLAPPCTAADGADADCWSGGVRTAALEGVTLGVGDYLIVRFTDRRTPTSGGIGIADFRVSSSRKPRVNCIIFR